MVPRTKKVLKKMMKKEKVGIGVTTMVLIVR